LTAILKEPPVSVGGAGCVACPAGGVDDGERVLVGEALMHRSGTEPLVDLVGAQDLGQGDGAFHFVPDLGRPGGGFLEPERDAGPRARN